MPERSANRKPSKAGFVRLVAPEGATHASHDGEMYAVEDGVIDVPQLAVQPLLSHGYRLESAASIIAEPSDEKSDAPPAS